jgi:hypothetical protein
MSSAPARAPAMNVSRSSSAPEEKPMAFKPNYNHQRAERNRAKEQKKLEKRLRRDEEAARRKGTSTSRSKTSRRARHRPRFRLPTLRRMPMARKKPRADNGNVLFDVFYKDGVRTSNRKVPGAILGGLDGDDPARGFIEEQDRKIAGLSGNPQRPIERMVRSSGR